MTTAIRNITLALAGAAVLSACATTGGSYTYSDPNGNQNRQNNHNRPNRRRKNQQSRHLTSAIGSALPRAMPRVSVLR